MAVARVHVRATALADVLVVAAVDVTARGQVHRFGLAAGSGLAAEAVAIAGRLVRRTFRAAARLPPGLDGAGAALALRPMVRQRVSRVPLDRAERREGHDGAGVAAAVRAPQFRGQDGCVLHFDGRRDDGWQCRHGEQTAVNAVVSARAPLHERVVQQFGQRQTLARVLLQQALNQVSGFARQVYG